jgi:hypothetical protein
MGDNYFFKEPRVITENYEIPAVGINNENPIATLDVGGDITACNIDVAELIQGKGINAGSNLYINGYSLYNQCPNNDEWDTIIPFRSEDGWIDSSWIKRPIGAADVIADIIDLAEKGVAIAGLISSIAAWLAGRTPESTLAATLPGALAGAVAGAGVSAIKDALESLLDDENENATESNQVRIAWQNVKKKPIATNINIFGTDRDVYLNNDKFIKLVNSGNFSTDSKDNKILNSTAGAINFIDLGNRKIYANQLHIGNNSNLTINSNNLSFNTIGTVIANQGIMTLNSNSLAIGKIDGSSVIPSYSISDNGFFLFKPTQSIYFNNNATLIGSNCVMTFNSNTFAYGSIDNSNVVSPILGVSGGVLTLHKTARILGPDETFKGSNNYARIDYSLSNGLQYGVGFTSSNINDIFNVNSNGNISTIGSRISFCNVATITSASKNTLFENGKSYDTTSTLTLNGDRMVYGNILLDQINSNIPSSNFVRPVMDISHKDGVSIYGRNAFLGSNSVFQITNVNDPLNSNISISNYPRLEWNIDAMRYGYGFCNNPAVNSYDVMKMEQNGILSTLDSQSMTLIPLTDQFANIRHGNTTIFKDGYIECSNIKVNGNLFIGDDVRINRLGMYLFGKKAMDFILQRLFSRYIEFDGIFDNPGFNPNFRQDYPDYFAL